MKCVEEAVTDGFYDVYAFNNIADAFKGDLEEKAELYISLVREEFIETAEAFKNKDAVELLDGVADVYVTVMGLIQILQKAGFDVAEAIQRVCANNLSKFPAEHEDENQPKDTDMFLCEEEGLYVYKDSVTGKVKKPLNYKPVYLADLVPRAFFKQ